MPKLTPLRLLRKIRKIKSLHASVYEEFGKEQRQIMRMPRNEERAELLRRLIAKKQVFSKQYRYNLTRLALQFERDNAQLLKKKP